MHNGEFDLMGYVDYIDPGQAVLVMWNEEVKFRRMFPLEFMERFGTWSAGDAFLVRVTDGGESPRIEFERLGNVRNGGPVSDLEEVLDISFVRARAGT